MFVKIGMIYFLSVVSLQAQTQNDYIDSNHPFLKKQNGDYKIRTWKYKKAATEYMNVLRTERGHPPVKLNWWLTTKCNLYSLWHSIFYRELRHAYIRANSWENLNEDIETYIDSWMKSPGHRANMMNRTTYKVGIGYIGGVAVQRGRFR